jgi:hypothetical protein
MVETNNKTDLPDVIKPNMDDDRSQEQISAQSGLVDHPYHIELTGSPNELSWPRVCANCGNAASEQIRVEKAFSGGTRRYRRSGSSGTRTRVIGAPIPFCTACAAEHRATHKKLTGIEKVMGVFINILAIPAIGLGWIAWKLLEGGLAGKPITTPEGKLGWSIVAVVVCGFFWTLYQMWETTRVDRVDPRTEITLACDFSRDVSQAFEKERRIYAMRNETFARTFAEFNKDRIWTNADQSRSNKRSRITGLILLVVLGIIAALLAKFNP